MPPSRKQQTLSTIGKALEEGNNTSITEIVQIIQRLAGNAFSISIAELSDLVSADPSITAKIISAANTLGYNPSGQPISTVADSIHTIGFEKVRNLAITILMAQTASNLTSSSAQKEVSARSICSGLFARTLAPKLCLASDPELLLVTASLRNYGELLLSAFLPEEFQVAADLSVSHPRPQAFKEVFGITPQALAAHFLEQASLPRSLLATLGVVELNKRNGPLVSNQTDEARIFSDLCSNIVLTTFDETIPPDQFNVSLTSTLDRYSPSLVVDLESANSALCSVFDDLTNLNNIIGIREEQSPGMLKLKARIEGQYLPKTPRERNPADRIADPNVPPTEEQAQAIFDEAMATFPPNGQDDKIDLSAAFATTAKSIRDGLALNSCLVFTHEEYDTRRFSAKQGIGPLFQKVKNRPLVAAQNKDIFSLCLERKEDILIQDTSSGKIRSVIPDWITNYQAASSLIVLPVLNRGQLYAILAGTMDNKRSIVLRQGDLKRLRSIRQELTSIIERAQAKVDGP